MGMLNKKSFSPFWRSPRALFSLVLVSIIFLAVVLFTGLFKNTPHPRTSSQYTKGEVATNANAADSKNINSSGSDESMPASTSQKVTGNNGVNTVLVAPTGNFVSNHHPSLNSSSPLNLESSVCTTSPGAACKIEFIKGSETKVLDMQTTDSGGSAYRDWHMQDIGLTEGTWSIQVVVNLNGQTKTTSDSSPLVVSQ
jgi:hypothetical protein